MQLGKYRKIGFAALACVVMVSGVAGYLLTGAEKSAEASICFIHTITGDRTCTSSTGTCRWVQVGTEITYVCGYSY